MITVDVVLNCNQSLFKNYRKKFKEMETQREHITQIERNLESLSVLVLILKKSFYFTFDKKQPLLEILKQLRGGGESVVYKLKQFYTF
jgi:hypothetical protein